MPSEHPGRYDREEFPEIEAKIGEDPARFLDRDLLAESNPTMAECRIRGIDDLHVIARWMEVEHKLERDTRDRIVELLTQRKHELEEIGERPDDVELAHAAARSRAERDELRHDEDDGIDLPPWHVRMGIPKGGTASESPTPDSDRDTSEQADFDAIATDGGEQ